MFRLVASILALGFVSTFTVLDSHASVLKKVTVPLSHVFIPKDGYDDNDQVTATVFGELSNPCYTLGKTVVSRDPSTRKLYFKQWAYLRTDGHCGTGDLIDDPVQFSNDVMLGQLDSGRYQIEFESTRGTQALRPFNIGKASPHVGIDNFDYALVNSADSSAFYHSDERVVIQIRGTIQSKCHELVRPLRVDRTDDVFVVMPILKETGENCDHQAQRFSEKIDLGVLEPGTYLLHMRSRNGKAVSQVFKVLSQ